MRYTKTQKEKIVQWLEKQISCENYLFQEQPTGPLGKRLATCVENGFNQGCDKVICIGADIPGIDQNIIHEMFDSLSHYDCVLGKALDGGYPH